MRKKYFVHKLKKNRRGRRDSWLKSALFFVWYGLLLIIIITAAVFIYFAKDLPNPQNLVRRQIIESTKIYDRTGEFLLYDVHGEEKRTIIPFEQIPDSLKNATLVIEDANFYHHYGIDLKGILRATLTNLRGKTILQGGSTITQQFIKSSFLTPERTLTRKVKEIILAIELEIKYSKDEILNFYLNQVPYGSNTYGIEAAAQTFFNKHAQDLTLAESALLAGLTKAPTYYSPYGSRPEELKNRQEYILDRMTELGYITPEQAEQAKNEELKLSQTKGSIKAPHFVLYVKEYLENEYGRDFIEQAGLKVYTTLDWDLQQIAEEIIEKETENNRKKFKAYNAALVALDPRTGQILSMVGSKNYFDDPLPQNCSPGKTCLFDPNVNITTRHRQPGSAFKPFAYAMAFQKGYTPETIVFDLETEFTPQEALEAGLDSYIPQNYDEQFRGPVTLRQGLAQSLNVPSVKTLYLAGVDKTISLAQEMGLTTLKDRSRFGLSLVLGGGEVKLLDETAAYGVFATQGIKHAPTAILKIEDKNGQALESFEARPKKVLDQQTANLINNILSDNGARTPVFGSSSPLYLPNRPAAAKTGTTQEYRDAWTIGYTPSLVAGVWAGNNNNAPMSKGAGVYVAAPIWNKFMQASYEVKNKEEFKDNEFKLPPEPENFINPEPILTDKAILNGQIENQQIIEIDKISGKLATALTPPELIEKKTYQEIHAILYYVDKDNPQSLSPLEPWRDPQFNNWEKAVLDWAKSLGRFYAPPPTEYDDIHTQINQPDIKIILPQNNQIITHHNLYIETEISAPLGIKQVDFFLNNVFIGAATRPPYNLNYFLPLGIAPGQHSLKVKVYDSALNRQEKEITFFLVKS